jgi:energy-coupling factor transporter ATP-binding protein EcfA2
VILPRMLTAATFRSFKALADVRVALGRSTCIVGANASGKTSVLEGIHCLARLAVPQDAEHPDKFDRVFSGRFTPHRILTAGSPGPIYLGVEADWEFHIELLPEDGLLPRPFRTKVRFRVAKGTPFEAERANDAVHLYDSLAATGLAATLRLRLDPARLSEPSYSESDVPRVESDGAGLPSVIAYLLSTRDPALAAIESDLEKIVPGGGKLVTKPARITRTETELVRINNEAISRAVERQVFGQRFELVGPRGKGVPADLLSEGTLLAIGLLTVLHTNPDLRLLLLDDIDRGLHPRAQRALVTLLHTIQQSRPDLQIVCTTHSPFVLDLFDPADVRVMRRDPEGLAHCQELIKHPNWPKWQSTLKAGEFWSFVGEDWV